MPPFDNEFEFQPEMNNEKQVAVIVENEEKKDAKVLRPWNVILRDSDSHSVQYVLDVLTKTCGMNVEQALMAAKKVHVEGRAVVYSAHKELAELKADQIRTFGADQLAIQDGYPCEGGMTVELEPAW